MTTSQISKRNQKAKKRTVSFKLTPHSLPGEYFLHVTHAGHENEPDVWWLTAGELLQLKTAISQIK